MPRFTYSQTAFNSGLLANTISKRVETEQYHRGARIYKNFIVTPQGPAERRRGLRYIAETKDSSKLSRMIPFVFSDEDSYAMEFGDGYIRFFRDFAPVLNQDVGITTNPTDPYEIVSPYTESDLIKIKYVQEGDIMYMTAGGTTVRPQQLIRMANEQFQLTDFQNENGPVLDVFDQGVTLTASAATGDITVTASADTFVAGHVGSLWELRDTDNTANSRGYFRITSINSPTSVNATVETQVVGEISGELFDDEDGSPNWGEAAWSGVRGYPVAISFPEQRLCFAATQQDPLAVYFSRSNANYTSFDYADAEAADAITAVLSGQTNTIQWIESDRNFLVAGTYGGLAFVGSGSATQALSINNIVTRNGEDFGSNVVQGVLFGEGVKYFQASGQRLYQANYDDVSIQYTVTDLTSLNDDILSSGVNYSFPQTIPHETLWCVTGDGDLVGFTEEVEQKVRAFSIEETNGKYESVCIVPNFGIDQKWCTIQRTINGVTRRYVEVQEPDTDLTFFVDSGVEFNGKQDASLTLSGTTGSITATAGVASFQASDVGRLILTFDDDMNPTGRGTITAFASPTEVTVNVTAEYPSTSIASGGWYLSATTISQLGHLEGEVVQVLSDGSFAGEFTVSGGAITLPNSLAGGLIYIGLKYESDLMVQPIEVGGRGLNGPAVTKLKRINRVGLSLYQSSAFKIGRDFDNLNIIASRGSNSLMNAPVRQFGENTVEDVVRSVNGKWDRDALVVVRQDAPLPLILAAMTMYMEVNDS